MIFIPDYSPDIFLFSPYFLNFCLTTTKVIISLLQEIIWIFKTKTNKVMTKKQNPTLLATQAEIFEFSQESKFSNFKLIL